MAAYSYGSLWWVRHQTEGLAQERADLVKQIGELKENAAEVAAALNTKVLTSPSD